MSNLSFENIEKAITKLEMVNLIKVYNEKENQILFELLIPLSPKEFNESFQLTELLKASAGNDNLEINNRLFNSLKNNSRDDEAVIQETLNKKEVKNNGNLNINYDFNLIKSVILSKRIDWNSFWNEELEKVILDLVIIYRVSALDLGLEIINLWENNKLSTETLKENITNEFKKRNRY